MSITVNADNVVQVACKEAGCKCVPIASKGLPVSIKLAIDNTMKDGASFVVLPVFEIDGLKVNCEFIVNENGMSLFIRTSKMLMYNISQHDERAFIVRQLLFRKTYIKKLTKYTLKDYESVIKHMNNDIQVMKFDKLNGVFVTPQIEHPREAPHVSSNLEILNSVPCDEKHAEECSVCLDTTKTMTPCGHKLCVSCWCQIKPNGRELPCPICRADLLQSKKIGIIDSRVDEDVADNEGEYDETEDWSDSDEESDDDDDEFPSVRVNTIMDMN
ncbi:MAG: hypothetical protein EBR55_09840 [Chitinophagia bacterium]|nr:hypothetical protein [Chitinophagia bacterium]